ncbi:hypothetical protein CC80DRAFT_230850 [Byssothecium circinans]|uniref:Uncharacterized protein n=1 Tax=Byssothecium circinans TaxID=147558 RepID=A0A6A5U9Y5_9PLEO|nr:hypothetical protein CC80DRAFT_230850 [Byssothecium circinans]
MWQGRGLSPRRFVWNIGAWICVSVPNMIAFYCDLAMSSNPCLPSEPEIPLGRFHDVREGLATIQGEPQWAWRAMCISKSAQTLERIGFILQVWPYSLFWLADSNEAYSALDTYHSLNLHDGKWTIRIANSSIEVAKE